MSPKAPKTPITQSPKNPSILAPAPAPAPEPVHTGLILPTAQPIPGTMRVKIKLLGDSAKVPTYGSEGAACFDLYAADTVAIAPGRAATVATDVAFEVPDGYVLMVYSRSGHGYKQGLRLVNGTGVIDSDYRGEVMVALKNDGKARFTVRHGERIAQMRLEPAPRFELVEAAELSATERGAGGFGSTGA